MATMEQIEKMAAAHAQARVKLSEYVSALQAGIEALKRQNIAKIKAAVNKAADTGDELVNLINDSPELFTKPKSVILHGIKLGYKKQKGKIEFDDPELVIKLIRKHCPELVDTLIVKTETPSKEALNNLSAADLKKLGVKVTSDTDVVFIAPADSEVDKLVNALLKGAEVEA